MEKKDFDINELRNLSSAHLKEKEQAARTRLNMMRMDIFSEKGKYTGEKRSLRKMLARILTIKKAKN